MTHNDHFQTSHFKFSQLLRVGISLKEYLVNEGKTQHDMICDTYSNCLLQQLSPSTCFPAYHILPLIGSLHRPKKTMTWILLETSLYKLLQVIFQHDKHNI